MKNLFSILIICLLFIFSQGYAGEIEQIRNKGEIVVSLNKGYTPFAFQIEKDLVGLDVDLARLMADYLGVNVRFITPEKFDEQIPRLIGKESDIIIAAMTRTIERGLQVNFSKPYFEVSQAAIVNVSKVDNNVNSYFDLVDIKGIRIGARSGTTIEVFARELFPEKAINLFPSHNDAIKALMDKQVDAFVADSPLIRVWTKSHPELSGKFRPLLSPVTREYYSFAIRKDDQEFLNWINLFIDQLMSDGTMELLYHKYFVEMSWLGQKIPEDQQLTRAQLMKNKFVEKKNERLEKLRLEESISGGAPYE